MLVAPTVVSATSTCCVFSYLYFLALIAPTLAYVMQFSQRIFIAVRWLECPIVKVQNGHHEIIKFKFSKPAKKAHSWQISVGPFVQSFIKIDTTV